MLIKTKNHDDLASLSQHPVNAIEAEAWKRAGSILELSAWQHCRATRATDQAVEVAGPPP
jgi:hypothetical protein